MSVLEVRDVGVRFGGLVALEGITARLEGPGTVGLIGPNGAGKSTLLNALSGFVRPTGEVLLDGEPLVGLTPQQHNSLGVTRSFQSARLLEEETVLDNLLLGRQKFSRSRALGQLFGMPASRRQERAWRTRAMETLDLLGLADAAHRRADSLSTATRRLVEIGRVLQAEPRVVFLDEPAAGLDSGSRDLLAETLRGLPGSTGCLLVLVEHDVWIVRRVCTTSIALVSGRVLASGPTDEVLARTDVRTAYFGEDARAGA